MKKKSESDLLNDYHLLSYDVLDSTNEEAKRLAAGGGSHGAVIWAKRQTNGRGRMNREWISAEGNLFVSVLLSPSKNVETCAQLSFVAALAVAETLEGILPDQEGISCKWPNDVLLEGKKLAGILLEAFSMPDERGKNRQWVVVGVGINVDSFPEHVMFPATCLKEAGVEIISAKIVLSRFIYNFIHRYDAWSKKGFKEIHAEWMQRAYHLGRPIEVIIGDKHAEGIFEGLDAHGRLLLRQRTGGAATITAGDVFFKD